MSDAFDWSIGSGVKTGSIGSVWDSSFGVPQATANIPNGVMNTKQVQPMSVGQVPQSASVGNTATIDALLAKAQTQGIALPENFSSMSVDEQTAALQGLLDDGGSIWNNPNLLKNIGTGAKAVGSLMNAYTGYQAMQTGKDQLAFQKEAFWANYNQQVKDREDSAARAKASATGVSQYK